jgi:hypothetical protein
MKLLVSGDSFTKGLIKVPTRNSEKEQNKINWGTQLGHLLRCEVINVSHWGAGTDYISYSIKNYLQNTEERDFFVIAAFSMLERQWGLQTESKYMWNPPHRKTDNIIELTYKNEMMIRGLHQYLDELNIPHFFTNAFCDFKYADSQDSDFKGFSLGNDEIKKYWLNWEYDSNTLYNIISGNYLQPNPIYMHSTQALQDFHDGTKYIAGCLHPSAEGHKLIARTFHPYVKPYFE